MTTTPPREQLPTGAQWLNDGAGHEHIAFTPAAFERFKADLLTTDRSAYVREALRAQAAVTRITWDEQGRRLFNGVLGPEHQAASVEAVGAKYFSYGPDSGYIEHDSADEAKKHAQSDIDAYRNEAASSNEWPDEAESVCWGIICESSKAALISEPPDAESCDYFLTAPPTPAHIPADVSPPQAPQAVVEAYSRTQPVNRTHEECDGCARLKDWPPTCEGHDSGPVACGQFAALATKGQQA